MKKIIALTLALVLALGLVACGAKTDDKTITVAASPTPHAEILKAVADVLNEEGWTLKIVEYILLIGYLLRKMVFCNGNGKVLNFTCPKARAFAVNAFPDKRKTADAIK